MNAAFEPVAGGTGIRRAWAAVVAGGAVVLALALPALFRFEPQFSTPTATVEPPSSNITADDPFYSELVGCVTRLTGAEFGDVNIGPDGSVTGDGQTVLDLAAMRYPVEFRGCFDALLGNPREVLVDADPMTGSRLAIGVVDGWPTTNQDLTPAVTDPQERLSISNYPLHPGGEGCAHIPVQAMEDLSPPDFLIQILKRAGSADGFSERPPTFAGRISGIDQGDHWECISQEARADIAALRWMEMDVEDQGFYLLIVVGREIPDRTLHQIERALDSFE